MTRASHILAVCAAVAGLMLSCVDCWAQKDLVYTLNTEDQTVPLPPLFRPNIDLSGRGLHNDITWPQNIAAKETLEIWQQDIGFSGVYRLQYNLWDISQLGKAQYLQGKLIENYEKIIKAVSDAGGTVILTIYGTPAGMGRVLDAKSVPEDVREYKALIKSIIRELSCRKRYTIWYEFWNAPDLDEFFLGRKQEYFTMYRAVAEAVKELRQEFGVPIRLGAPGISWWFQNTGGNTIATPESSMIYELIKYCYRYRLPLDFISWHAYSSDDRAEKELSRYDRKTAVRLIRDWLSYFDFDEKMPLVIDEWNYDQNANVLPERAEQAHIAASYIPSRLRHMYEAGITHQVYFCLEDFQNNKEGVVRNVGAFAVDANGAGGQGGAKVIYNVFRMLSRLGPRMFVPKRAESAEDEFAGVIATKGENGTITLLVYNYVDPESARNYISRHISSLSPAERKILLRYIENGQIDQVMRGERTISSLRLTNRMRAFLKKTLALHQQAYGAQTQERVLRLSVKNLNGAYLYQRYVVDSSCSMDCAFSPKEEKVMSIAEEYQQTLRIKPYTAELILLQKKSPAPPPQGAPDQAGGGVEEQEKEKVPENAQ